MGLSPGPGTTSAIVVTRLRRDIAALGPSVALKGTQLKMHEPCVSHFDFVNVLNLFLAGLSVHGEWERDSPIKNRPGVMINF